MSFTINLGQIAVRDGNGQYVTFDATTQANMDAIVAKKDEAIAEIDSMINSIPEDYTELTNKVERLGNDYNIISNAAIDELVNSPTDDYSIIIDTISTQQIRDIISGTGG